MILQTSRSALHVILEEDILLLHDSIFSDPKVMAHTFGGRIFTQAETERFLAEYAAKEGEKIGIGILTLKENASVIGFAGLLPYRTGVELGFVLSPEYWGEGYATEIGSGQIVLGHALGFSELFARVSPQNYASKAVVEKLGMQYLHTEESTDRGLREIYHKETG